MDASRTIIELLPDWYLIERETEKTIDKLNNLKELNYYFDNADEYVRRLAILRIKTLGLKESARILKDVMDNPVESHANKQIAAWALKSLLVESDSDYIMSSRYLANFSCYEKYDELFIIASEQHTCNVRFQFSSSPYFSAFNVNDEDIVLEKDIFFETDFDVKQWFACLISGLKTSTKNIPLCIIKLVSAFVTQFWNVLKAVPKHILRLYKKRSEIAPKAAIKKKNGNSYNTSIEQINSKNQQTDIFTRRAYIGSLENEAAKKIYSSDQHYDYSRIRKEMYHRPGFFAFVKKGVFQLFYLLFFPVRFAIKHKFASFCILLSLYAFFAYFSYGRAMTNKYAGFDLQEVQAQFFKEAGVFYNKTIEEINRITGINEWKENSKTQQASNDILKTSDITLSKAQNTAEVAEFYTVSAKDGLNMRSAPDPSSEKVGKIALPFGTSVTFISSAYSEAAGIDWFFVKAEDGRVGWVSSKYLKKVGDK